VTRASRGRCNHHVMATTDDQAPVNLDPAAIRTSSPIAGLRTAMVVVAIVVAAADQISKSVVLATKAGLTTSDSGWFAVQLQRNHGVSRGIGAGHPLLVTGVEILGIVFVGVLALRTRNRTVAIALALVLGGALGNLADRFVRSPGLGRGAVVDWIHLGGRGGSMDLADVAIQLGAVVALLATLYTGWADARRDRR
jgi:signal peptidase II